MIEGQAELVLVWTRKTPDAGILFSTYKSRQVSILPQGNAGSAGREAYVNGNTIGRGYQTVGEAEDAIIRFIDGLQERRKGRLRSDLVNPNQVLVLRLYHVHNPFVTDQEYGCYSDVVIAVPDEDSARAFVPHDQDFPADFSDKLLWPGDPEKFIVRFLGTAAPGSKAGQILATQIKI